MSQPAPSASLPGSSPDAPPGAATPDSSRQERLFLLYHEVRSAGSDYTYAIALDRLEQHLGFLAQLRRTGATGLVPEITFDDGHASDVHLAAPALARHGLHAHFFITAGWTGTRPGFMDWAGVRALHSAGHRIGAHGWSHRLLTHCSPGELRQQLEPPRVLLEDRLGCPVTTMSLPGGRADRRVFDACQEAGYTQVFTSAPRPEPNPDAPVIGRLNLRGDVTIEFLHHLFEGDRRLLHRLQRSAQAKEIAKNLLGDRLYARLWGILNHEDRDSAEAGAAAK